jgi:hypothetical protein
VRGGSLQEKLLPSNTINWPALHFGKASFKMSCALMQRVPVLVPSCHVTTPGCFAEQPSGGHIVSDGSAANAGMLGKIAVRKTVWGYIGQLLW